MAIEVIIRRKIKSDNPEELIPLVNRMRSLAINQAGYISGRTLKSISKPGDYMVISQWQTKENWENWFNSKERRDIQYKIDSLIGERTFYDVYEPLAH